MSSCHPILLLRLPKYDLEDLRHIFIHDIVFSSRATFGMNYHWDSGTCLHMLNYLDGKSLVSIARVFGGPVIVDEEDLFVSTDDYGCSVNMKTIDQLSQGDMQYQAIVTDDTNMINYPAIGNFVGKQYHNCDTSVVIMTLGGIFKFSGIHQNFGIQFEVLEPTNTIIDLSDLGKSTIGEDFVPHELFVKVANPEEFEDDHEDDAELEDDHEDDFEFEDDHEDDFEFEDDHEDDFDYEVFLKAASGAHFFSPLVTHFDGSKCLSFFSMASLLISTLVPLFYVCAMQV